jgi:hypothetical protein
VHAATGHALTISSSSAISTTASMVTPASHGFGLGNGAREAVEQEAVGAVGWAMRSLTRLMIRSSDTRPPASMTLLACRPSSVPALTAARSMSPVEICGMPNFSVMNLA